MIVAPGANNWSRLYPDLEAAYVNIHNFVRDGRKHGAIGVLNTPAEFVTPVATGFAPSMTTTLAPASGPVRRPTRCRPKTRQ